MKHRLYVETKRFIAFARIVKEDGAFCSGASERRVVEALDLLPPCGGHAI
jgi:hypothetical protein